mmetsp:Transcript_9535/g.22250  ORF Transcript_9535/g.22250 Transcript_9535/m.22250 type:complete len:206 (+) Transcript_9535:161-778(+)
MSPQLAAGWRDGPTSSAPRGLEPGGRKDGGTPPEPSDGEDDGGGARGCAGGGGYAKTPPPADVDAPGRPPPTRKGAGGGEPRPTPPPALPAPRRAEVGSRRPLIETLRWGERGIRCLLLPADPAGGCGAASPSPAPGPGGGESPSLWRSIMYSRSSSRSSPASAAAASFSRLPPRPPEASGDPPESFLALRLVVAMLGEEVFVRG